jgi:hypothetical protein
MCGIYKKKLTSQKLRVEWWLPEAEREGGREEWEEVKNGY